MAIREGKTFIFAKPTIPNPTTRVYLDLEGDPEASFVYLAGILVVGQALGRQVAADAEDNRTLAALGLGRQELVLVSLTRAGIVAHTQTLIG